jgi:hypothetical protein
MEPESQCLAGGAKHFKASPASLNSSVRGMFSQSHIRLLTHCDIVEGSKRPQLLVQTLAAAEKSLSTEHEAIQPQCEKFFTAVLDRQGKKSFQSVTVTQQYTTPL